LSLASFLEPPVLCIITDDARSDREIVDSVESACAAVRSIVQLRVRDRSGGRAFSLATALRAITRRHDCGLFINDRLDVAMAVDADGVHLPAHGMAAADVRRSLRPHPDRSPLLIGRSVHSLVEIEREAPVVDYLHFGPVFVTPEKMRFGGPLGLAELQRAVATAGTTPIIAVGGIDDSRVAEVIAAGAAGIAVIRAVMSADRVGEAAHRLAASLRAPSPNA
jgi:thiamine-phosphate pyrophosphorylase